MPFKRSTALALATASLLALHAPVRAQAAGPDWKFGVGAGVVSGPSYIGSDDQRTRVLPNFSARYQNWFFATVPDGVGVQTTLSGIKLSGALGLDFNDRDPKDNPRLSGFSKVGIAPALRLKAEYGFGDVGVSALLSSRLGSSTKSGSTLQLDGGYSLLKGPQLFGSVGLSARVMDGRFADNLIGVSAQNAAASGLSPYKAGAGLLDAGVYVQGTYVFNERWSIFSRVQFMQLQGDAADSPIVLRKNQPSVLLFGNYAF